MKLLGVRLSSDLKSDEGVCDDITNCNQWNPISLMCLRYSCSASFNTRIQQVFTPREMLVPQNTYHAIFSIITMFISIPIKSHYRDGILPSNPRPSLLGLLQYSKLLTSCLGSPPPHGLSCQPNCWPTYPVPGVPP